MTAPVPPKGRAPDAADYFSPDGAEIRLVLRPEVEGVAYHSVSEATFRPGQVSRAMRHQHVEESWYVLDGEAEVWRRPADGSPASTVRLGPGEALNIPPGFGFQVRVLGAVPLRLLCSTAPPWPGADEAIPVDGGLGSPAG